MGWIGPAIYGVSTLAGILGRPKRGESVEAINNKYRGERVSGYLSPEDRAQVERTRTGGVAAAERGAELTRGSIYRQINSRHLSGASAAALQLTADQQAAEGRDKASMFADDQGYKLYKGNEQYERDKQATAWGNAIGQSTRQGNRADLQDATFWNSVLEGIPGILSLMEGKGATTAATETTPGAEGRYDPLDPSKWG